jgi:hypothetical protein
MRSVISLKAVTCAVFLALISFLFGCRAFEPEVIIINHPPETYIIAAPMGDSGGRFHYHLYWYGTDDDGRVVNYVWALTDSTIQDPETDDDEEDSNFNPAIDITDLQIGHWTSRTDTIIDFQINNGFTESRDMTFHIVAQDDRGDFDRTPARLHFISNALGRPFINFYASDVQDESTLIPTRGDGSRSITIGYGRPFQLSWDGGTPNDFGANEELLAMRDSVPPYDGLFGFKYRLPVDVICDQTVRDCWNPVRFDGTLGSEVSYYGDLSVLTFTNEDPAATDIFNRRLANGVHTLLVSTVDMAGVELQDDDQKLEFIINYDPDTRILREETAGEEPHLYEDDPFNPGQNRVYPYYYLFDQDGNHVSDTVFAEGDTLPNRSIVVFKAVGQDNPEDLRFPEISPELDTGYNVMFQGRFEGLGNYRGAETARFPINTEYSPLAQTIWEDHTRLQSLSADTLSFNVGPFNYLMSMRSSDEHERRDNTPDVFAFSGNFEPVVHAVEVGALTEEAPEYHNELAEATIDTLYLTFDLPGIPDDALTEHPDWEPLYDSQPGTAWVRVQSGLVLFEEPLNISDYIPVPGNYYEYELRFFGQDSEKEQLFIPAADATETPEGNPEERMMAWVYGITGEFDTSSLVRDGNGVDNEYYGDSTEEVVRAVTYEFENDISQYPSIDDNGVWHLKVKVFVPQILQFSGITGFYTDEESYIKSVFPQAPAEGLRLTTIQMGNTYVSVQGRDATTSDINDEHCRYVYYSDTRILDGHGDSCTEKYPGSEPNIVKYNDFARLSEVYNKQFVIKVRAGLDGSYYPSDE